jgi:iron complex outermembrane receptor protein
VDSTDASGIYVQHRRDYQRTDIAFSPSSVAAVILSIKPVRDLEITFTEKFVGRQYLDNTSNSSKTIDPYAVLDALINYTLKTKISPEITFMLSAYNVFSKAYATNGYTFSQYYGGELSHYNYFASAAPLNFLGGLSLKF